jgi:hypothetical protein
MAKQMIKRADGSYSKRGLWDNIRAKAAANKKAGKKGNAPSEDILREEKAINAKKTGGKSMSSFLENSKELKFGGPTKKQYLVGGPEKPSATALDANGFDANGRNPITKKYTDAANKERLKQVFAGTHTTDPRDQTLPLIPKPKKPMADISTAGLRPMAPAESTNTYTRRLKSGGKKKMGGKNC